MDNNYINIYNIMPNIIPSDWCCMKQIKPLFDDINEKDLAEPLRRLDNPYLNEYITKEPNDVMINYYIKSVKDISIISIFPKALKQEDNMVKLLHTLKENGTIYYVKDLSVNFYTMYNIIYHFYAHEKRMKNNGHIIYKLNRLGFEDTKSINNLKIIVYKHINTDIPIKGNSSPFKMKLRELFTLNENDSYYDFLHINNDDNESYEYSNIFFNENTMKFLNKQQSWKILDMRYTIRLFNRLKDFYNDYSLMEVENSIVFSSGILFSYGIREINDLDIIMLASDKILETDIDKFNNNKEYDMDISYEKSASFNKEWIEELNSRAVMCGAKDYRELILNPKFHYYFMGIKFLRLKCDILIRFKRGRPAQITDLLILRQALNLNYQLSIPKETKVYDEKEKKDIIKLVNKNTFLSTVKHYLEKRYYIDISLENIEKWISNDKIGGNNILIKMEDMSNKKYVYPTIEELIKMGFNTNVTIYSSNKPYLYEGEDYPYYISKKYCKVDKFINPPNNKLRIMTFNLHNMITRCNQGISPIFGNNLNPFEKPRDIRRFINFFKKSQADILCLQEIVPITKFDIKENITDYEFIRNNFNFEYFNELMANIGYKYKIISSTMNGFFIKEEHRNYYYLGNAIYSKYELTNSQIYQYNFLNRNFITTTVKYNNIEFNLVNIHWEYFKDENKLILQTKLLIDKLKELYNLNNIVLCGDFNINLLYKQPGKRYIDWDQKTFFVKPHNNMFEIPFKLNKPTNYSQDETTDYILVSKQNILKCISSNVIQTNISDHYAVYSDFIINNTLSIRTSF
jgi:endonuclease/exonuclease/phosphatase family metal-dependent hydrolase